MIGYRVPPVLQRLSPQQVFDEGITSFLGVGIFLYLAAANETFTFKELHELAKTDLYSDLRGPLEELENAGLIERTRTNDLDTADLEVGGAA